MKYFSWFHTQGVNPFPLRSPGWFPCNSRLLSKRVSAQTIVTVRGSCSTFHSLSLTFCLPSQHSGDKTAHTKFKGSCYGSIATQTKNRKRNTVWSKVKLRQKSFLQEWYLVTTFFLLFFFKSSQAQVTLVKKHTRIFLFTLQ